MAFQVAGESFSKAEMVFSSRLVSSSLLAKSIAILSSSLNPSEVGQ